MLLTAGVYRTILPPVPNMPIPRTWPTLILPRRLSLNKLIPRLGPALVTVQHPRVSLISRSLTALRVRPSAAKKWPRLVPLGQTEKVPRSLGPTHTV